MIKKFQCENIKELKTLKFS